MPPRIQSPYKPARPALVEPICQPLYGRVVVEATPAAQYFFFNVSQGAPGQNPVFTNLEVPSQLPNPKIFVVRGYRLHLQQRAAFGPAANVNFLAGSAELVESYWYRFFIGVKEYLRVPAFYLTSGLGLWVAPAGAGGATTNEWLSPAQVGVPHHENYYKIVRRPIVLPPQQNFQAELNRGPALSTLTGGDHAVWNFLEGDLGREVM